MQVDVAQAQDENAMKQLQEEHRRYAERLEAFAMGSIYLSADDQMEEVRLKKLKLRVKDALAGYRPPYPVSS